MSTYETIFITVPNITEDEERTTVDGLEQVVTEGGGSLVTRDRMGRRRLAYPIRKFEDGIYVRFLYDAGPEVPKELERRTRLSENVLRSLTVRLELDWARYAKEEAVREAERRADAEAAAAAEAEKARVEQEAAAAAGETESDEAAPTAAAATESDAAESADQRTEDDGSSEDTKE